jgi:hypothetical protein
MISLNSMVFFGEGEKSLKKEAIEMLLPIQLDLVSICTCIREFFSKNRIFKEKQPFTLDPISAALGKTN